MYLKTNGVQGKKQCIYLSAAITEKDNHTKFYYSNFTYLNMYNVNDGILIYYFIYYLPQRFLQFSPRSSNQFS